MTGKYVVFGYGYEGVEATRLLFGGENEFLGFVDNNQYMKGNYSYNKPIMDFDGLLSLYKSIGHKLHIIVASRAYTEIIKQCEETGLHVDYVWMNRRFVPYPFRDATFDSIDFSKEVRLYAGDINDEIHMHDDRVYALSITHSDEKHIRFDITNKYPLPDSCVDLYEAENVFEFIEKEKMIDAINEIYRILKKGAAFRLTLPDYNSPYMLRRCMRDPEGKILYDPGESRIIKWGRNGIYGGTLEFTTYENVREMLNKTRFKQFNWLRFYDANGGQCRKYVDQSLGYSHRVSNDEGARDFNILVDCIK